MFSAEAQAVPCNIVKVSCAWLWPCVTLVRHTGAAALVHRNAMSDGVCPHVMPMVRWHLDSTPAAVSRGTLEPRVAVHAGGAPLGHDNHSRKKGVPLPVYWGTRC